MSLQPRILFNTLRLRELDRLMEGMYNEGVSHSTITDLLDSIPLTLQPGGDILIWARFEPSTRRFARLGTESLPALSKGVRLWSERSSLDDRECVAFVA